MKQKPVILLAVILTLAMTATTVFAWGHGRGGFQGARCAGQMKGCMRGAVDALSPELQDSLTELHQRFLDETADIRAQLAGKVEEMRILMRTSTPDRERLVTLAQAIGDLDKQIMIKRIDLALEARSIAPELDLADCFERFQSTNDMGMRGFGNMGGPCRCAGCPRFQQNSF